MKNTVHTLAALCVVVLLVTGCSSADRLAKKSPPVYKVSGRQLPPEPLYYRVKTANLADMVPSKELPYSGSAEKIAPQYFVELKNVTVEYATKYVADSLRYAHYTASTIADKKVTVRVIGGVEEIASALAEKANADVVIDHENREVRSLAKRIVGTEKAEPAFAQ